MSQERYLTRLSLARDTDAPFGAGAFVTGNVLLIGEQSSDPLHDTDQQPFCSSKGCSGWLNDLLEAENIPEDKLFWVNAKNNDGSTISLLPLVAALKPSTIIALGSVARKLCEIQDVKGEFFHHPQFCKRFRHQFPYPLISRLKELCEDQVSIA